MSYQELPVQMHPKYQEFLSFMADCPHRKTPSTMETAFWAWLKNKPSSKKFKQGDRVKKKSGSQWQGCVVGFYSTKLTPTGYAVESESHLGSVQIYPENALELV